MNKELEKELKLRISMLEAKVDLLLSMFNKESSIPSIEQAVLCDLEQQEIENEMHNDLLILSV